MASYHSSHARHTGKTTPVGSANRHKMGSKKGKLPSAAGKTMGQPADRFPGATGQMGTSAPGGGY